MIPLTVFDTGPLVAFLSEADEHHAWASEAFDGLAGRLMSCESVVSEASFILARNGHRRSVVLELVERLGVELVPLGGELRALRKLMDRYATIPMSYADACLVRLAELHTGSVVMTCDSDFLVYRMSGRRVVKTLMPPR